MIRFDHVKKSFGENCILEDFSLQVREGEFLTVIGKSGCGKTTMLKLVNGLLMPDSGQIFVEGKDLAGTDLVALRRRIGYVIQNGGIFPHMTVEKNITYVPVISGRKNKIENHRLALRLLRTVGLEEEMAARYPSELSGGQQQRVGIARALAASPRILLMDEPFGALDEITRQTMQDEILRLQKELKLTIVFITHDIREAMKLGDRMLVMEQGKVRQLDTPERIRLNPADAFVRELVKGHTGAALAGHTPVWGPESEAEPPSPVMAHSGRNSLWEGAGDADYK
ncbi:ATP-binding cassette domain-containing protein [Schaedlerella arabinosiphila]|uniref:ATP-binding cassette domain-containing protein n=1 Tax=Schaedlerella arabinosiphila TaxID=2044587 RepID=UPI0025581909|nr:ABC transporter ATP-binding protein [Schaedlerella arabinosiphila]